MTAQCPVAKHKAEEGDRVEADTRVILGLHWEFALSVLEVGDVYGGHRGREDDDEGEGGVLGAGLVAQPPELHRLHLLVTHLNDELLRGGLEPDVHQEPDVSAGGAPLSNINSLFPWETLVKFYSCFCNLMEECSSESLDINISASFGSDILHCVPCLEKIQLR